MHDTDSAAEDVFAFLQLFFSQFPGMNKKIHDIPISRFLIEYSKLDFHVAGESCKYIQEAKVDQSINNRYI